MDKNIDFAFEGFRVIRHRPVLILYWGVVSVILSCAVQWVMVSMFGPIMDQMMTGGAGGATTMSPAEATQQLTLLAKLLPFYGLLLIGSVIYYAIMNCAVYRAVLGSKKSAFGFLRLGADELRQVAVMVLFFLLLVVIYIALMIVVSILGGILIAVISGGGSSAAVMAVTVAVIMLLVLCPLVWFCVRMSLYTVHTFATGKIDLFGSWKLTKNRFWILFAGYLVTLVMCFLVMALFWAIFAGVAAVLGMNGVGLFGQMMGVGAKPSYAALYSNPLMIGYTVSSAFFLSPLLIGLIGGAPAAAYHRIAGQTTRISAENVF